MYKPLLVFSCACVFVLIPSFQCWKFKTATSAGSVLRKKSNKRHNNDNHNFPVTDFTPHVNQLLELVDFDGGCGARITLTVSEPFTVPTAIDCSDNRPQHPNIVDDSWCTILKRIFLEKKQILPTNITVSFSRADRLQLDKHGYRCFESSSLDGEFCMMNFLEMERMKDGIEYPIIPWENRSSIPIWRGMPWMKNGEDVKDPSKVVEDAIARSPRLGVVAWSYDHPDLLDAKIGTLESRLRKHPYWKDRGTNGMSKLYPGESFIPPEDYYTKYQVAVVLGGFGAAFRTSIHLSTATAIALQEYRFKEWFTPMLKPFEHYIPLREDLSDLDETMRWVAENPTKVRQIARNGHEFYQRYLSFERNEAHIAELVYRMALMKRERE